MHDAAMRRMVQSVSERRADAKHKSGVERAHIADFFSQRPPLDQFHRDEADALVDAEVIDLREKWTVEPGGGLGFLFESPTHVRFGGIFRIQDFERDKAV